MSWRVSGPFVPSRQPSGLLPVPLPTQGSCGLKGRRVRARAPPSTARGSSSSLLAATSRRQPASARRTLTCGAVFLAVPDRCPPGCGGRSGGTSSSMYTHTPASNPSSAPRALIFSAVKWGQSQPDPLVAMVHISCAPGALASLPLLSTSLPPQASVPSLVPKVLPTPLLSLKLRLLLTSL